MLQNTWHLPSSCPFGFELEARVIAEDLTLTIRNEPDLHVWDGEGVTSPELFFWPLVGGARQGAVVAELSHFIECCGARVPSPVAPVQEMVHGIEVASALIRSSRTGAWEPVSRSVAR
ncbi:MAG: hypothetical protein R3F14_32575 [Polyangiaceae bacterium]